MSHHSDLIATDIEAYLAQHERKELLRFITCGSVDDGKSTLIGRLLYDSKMIYEDTLEKICKDSAVHGTTGGGFDPALLTDGLKAEREQGITIDVAYRYFSTAKRKFIIADTPGHVQYTRNMATGASTADLAIILVDARYGILEQTRRHSFIVSLLGIRHILVAINKMDLVDYQQEVFDRIRQDYLEFATRLDIPDLHFLPMAALHGDNVVDRSQHLGWYTGPTLMEYLETVYVGSDRNLEDLRFPIQYVLRPHLDFRGFAGTVASGIVRKGDTVMVLPGGQTSRIRSIVTHDGEWEEAFAGQAVTLTLEDEVDVSRGNMIVRPGNIPQVGRQLEAMLVWMHEAPMVPGRQYLFKQTTQTVTGSISTLRYLVDVNTLHRQPAPTLGLNQIGRCRISLSQPLLFDGYRRNRATGSFIVIDRLNNATVAAGMILDRQVSETGTDNRDEAGERPSASSPGAPVTGEERSARYGQQPATVLFTGRPGSGKSSLARATERALFDAGRTVAVIDEEDLQPDATGDRTPSAASLAEVSRQRAGLARLINAGGWICLMPVLPDDPAAIAAITAAVGPNRAMVVRLDAPPEVCEARRGGALPTAAHDPAATSARRPEPDLPAADLVLDTHQTGLADCVRQVIELLRQRAVFAG